MYKRGMKPPNFEGVILGVIFQKRQKKGVKKG